MSTKYFFLLIIILRIKGQRSTVVAHNKKNIICYHRSFSAYRKSQGQFDVATDLDPLLCTHLMYAFIGIYETGELRVKDPHLDLDNNKGPGNLRKFNSLKLKNPNLKTLLSVGGGQSSKNFSLVAANSVKRSKFIESAAEYMQVYGFDGLDLDWEYPNRNHPLKNNNDRENLVILLREIKEVFKSHGYLLTAAVGPAEYTPQLSYNITDMVKYLDLINVMAYDLHGAWESVVGHNAPLYAGPLDTTERAKQHSFDALAKYWISQGAPRNKLVMGIPFYGRSFILKDPNNHTTGAFHNGRGIGGQYTIQPGILGYNELCEKFNTENSLWNLEWDPVQMVPFVYNDLHWISYDNETSIALKANYVNKENLAGIMIWTIELDDFRGVCGSKRYPLLRIINKCLDSEVPGNLISDILK